MEQQVSTDCSVMGVLLTADNHPYLKSVCDVAESSVRSITSVGLSSAEPLLQRLEPQTEEATKPEGYESSQDSFYVRLGSLSTKARRRTYQQAVEYTRKNMNDAGEKIQNAQEKIYNKWLEWSKGTGQDAGGDPESTEDMESRTLAIARNLSHQLKTTCVSLVTSVQGLPQSLQKKAQDVSAMAAEVYQTFHAASSFREMSASLLTSTKEQLTNMKGSLEEVLDVLVNNSPLNWLVGSFNPQLAGSQEGEQESDGEDSANQEH
ncbi:hypothetical protein GDO78_022534 [Eleutherodactylus coqui]|uniref:Perilipin n=1 Tax=Eleutherodactylus coqui TaxID=57060 RepID=A0A8J6EG21_ELECQ|nr:hypothetical protein GDO78_022534 [Eleutherodactylus coqui]